MKRTKKRTKILMTCLLAAWVSAAPAMAASSRDQKAFGGVLLGINTPLASNASTLFSYGVNGGYKFTPELAGGVFFYTGATSTSQTSPFFGTLETTNRTSLLGVEGNYFLTDAITVGAKLGLALYGFSSNVAGAAGASSNDLIIGPRAGYDYRLNENITIGGEVNLLFGPSDPFLGVLANAKYWF